MTNLLAPGLLIGLASPANVGAGVGGKSPPGDPVPGPNGTFAALLSGVMHASTATGGETGPPDGGALLKPDTTLLALLEQLAVQIPQLQQLQGTLPEAELSAATGLSLLDRPAGAGETHEGLDGTNAVETLMESLVMAQQIVEQPTAQPSMADARALFATATAMTDASSGVFEDGGEQLAAALARALGNDALRAGELAGGEVATNTGVDAPTPAARATATALLDGTPSSDVDAPGTAGVSTLTEEPVVAAIATAERTTSTAGGRVELPRGMTEVEPQPFAGLAQSSMADEPMARPVAGGGDAAAVTGAATAAAMAGTNQPISAPNVEAASTARVVNAAALPSEMANVVTSAVIRGDSEVRLVLNPPELGELKVSIVSTDGALRIAVEASQSGARDLMERSLPALLQALEARELKVDRLEVRAADTGRGSLDTANDGGNGADGQGAGQRGSSGDEAHVEWSPVASLGGVASGTAGSEANEGASEQRTVVDGHVDVLA